MKTFEGTHARIDKNFLKNLQKMYPDNSSREATKKLNLVLEEMLYGPKNKKGKV